MATEVSMTETRARTRLCKCGHPRAAHPDEHEEACAVPECVCGEFIPNDLTSLERLPVIVAASPVAQSSTPDPVSDVLDEGRRSPIKRTAALAVKIDALVSDLRERLVNESEQAQALREIAALERKLAEAKARLRGGPAVAGATSSADTFACPDCESTFTTPQGRGAHRAHAHGYRRIAS